VVSPALNADTIRVQLSELDSALAQSQSEPDAVQRLVLEKISQRFDALDINLQNGDLLFEDAIIDEVVEDGCASTIVRRMDTEIKVLGDSSLSFTLDSLYDPISISLEIAAQVDAMGRAKQVIGFRFGECVSVATDNFDFAASGPLRMRLDLSLSLNPDWVDADTLRITPDFTLKGELLQSDLNVEVEDSYLRGVIESFLQDEVDDVFNAERLEQELGELQAGLQSDIAAESTNGSYEIELPPATDDQILALYELLSPQSGFPLTAEFLNERRLEILAALISGDKAAIDALLSDAAYCQLSDSLQVPLTSRPVYEQTSAGCVVSNLNTETILFGDAACAESFDYFPTNYAGFCQEVLSQNRLGNANSRTDQLQRWTQSPGSSLEVGALPITGKALPFVQRVNYKNVGTASGNCRLEMRVYKSNPTARNEKIMIALHGGSWQNRSSGFLGIENAATHFVSEGFTVFAPFYRLIASEDGSVECQNATLDELLLDVRDAFDWVKANADSFGAQGKPALFGQSAGGHLAAYLAVTQPEQVDRAVLLYAPLDFEDFGGQIKSGSYTNQTGINIMRRVTGQDIDSLDLQSRVVQENTFTKQVQQSSGNYPPMFMLHGESDSLLPVTQSVRMCNALSGNLDAGPATNAVDTGRVKNVVTCDDRGSSLHLVGEGEHTLDLCISDELCLSGSPASAAATADSMQSMLDWSTADLSQLTSSSTATNSGGSGRLGLEFLMFLVGLVFFSRRLPQLPRS